MTGPTGRLTGDGLAGTAVGSDAPRGRPRKSPTAFRTISEVADELHIPQHVLRFWETRFPQVKPLKRGGGRRYYRPDDIALLRSISHLLYVQGYTIKGVQRLLREGDGALGDDIPPASDAERSDAQAERDLLSEPSPSAPARSPEPDLAHATIDRAVLRGVLAELEAIRALLPTS